jgi:ABC-type uncharacterized transport system ATPase subunit
VDAVLLGTAQLDELVERADVIPVLSGGDTQH